MKKVLIILMIYASLAISGDKLILSEKQYNNLEYAYSYGKLFGLENTIRAIVMVESSGGINIENKHKMACGWGQIYVKSWKKRYSKELGKMNLSDRDICTLLKKDIDLNLFSIAGEIRHWQKVHGKNSWNKIYASYYAGYGYSSDEAKLYSNKVIKTIKIFKGKRYEIVK
jgi:hypothetical protein